MPILGSKGGLSSRGFGQSTETLPPPTEPVEGYHLWLDSDNAASFTYSSGNVVSQWTDRSANAFTFTTAAVVNQPTRNGVQNSKSTVVFDGSRNYLKSTAPLSTWKYLHDGSGATLFFVVKSNEQVQPATYIFSQVFSTGSSTGPTMAFGFFGGPIYAYNTAEVTIDNGTSAIETPTNFVYNSNYNVHSVKLDLNSINKISYYLNSSTPYITSLTFSPSTADPEKSLCLGTGFNGIFGDVGGYPEYMFAGEIAEILTYKSILSESDRISNVNYLEAKWGIPPGRF